VLGGVDDGRVVFRNSDVLCNVKEKLSHSCTLEGEEMASLITEFSDLFSDVAGRTDCIHHHVDVENSIPIKQNPLALGSLSSLRENLTTC